jgi:hypothetical protein
VGVGSGQQTIDPLLSRPLLAGCCYCHGVVAQVVSLQLVPTQSLVCVPRVVCTLVPNTHHSSSTSSRRGIAAALAGVQWLAGMWVGHRWQVNTPYVFDLLLLLPGHKGSGSALADTHNTCCTVPLCVCVLQPVSGWSLSLFVGHTVRLWALQPKSGLSFGCSPLSSLLATSEGAVSSRAESVLSLC